VAWKLERKGGRNGTRLRSIKGGFIINQVVPDVFLGHYDQRSGFAFHSTMRRPIPEGYSGGGRDRKFAAQFFPNRL